MFMSCRERAASGGLIERALKRPENGGSLADLILGGQRRHRLAAT